MWSVWIAEHAEIYFSIGVIVSIAMWTYWAMFSRGRRAHFACSVATAFIVAPVPFGVDSAGFVLPAWMFLLGISFMLPVALIAISVVWALVWGPTRRWIVEAPRQYEGAFLGAWTMTSRSPGHSAAFTARFCVIAVASV